MFASLFLFCYYVFDCSNEMTDMKRLFYVWFLGARECRGLRGDEFVRPIVRYVVIIISLPI